MLVRPFGTTVMLLALFVGQAPAAPPLQQRASSQPASAESHWAFQRFERPAVPAVDDPDWCRNAIDRFVLARLEAEGLAPVADASPATLLRRLTFDLAGLPPTIEQQDEFLHQPDRDAWASLVDRLLASPEFGVRWGQHWLDVARFAESSGGGRSLVFPQAWRYRDYVIDSLNADKPLDRFVVEQLAGDLLPSDTSAQHDEQHIATGFLLLGPINYEVQDKELLEMEVVDEQLDTIGRALLGMTLGCARCHDHKFDPISARDYYGLAGFFTSTRSIVHENVGTPHTEVLEDESTARAYQEYREALESLESQRKELVAQLKQAQSALKKQSDAAPDDQAETNVQRTEQEKLTAAVKSLEEEIAQLKAEAPLEPRAMAVADGDAPADTHVLVRGVVRRQGEVAPRSFLTAACDSADPAAATPDLAADQSGRLQLARWIASPDNPLTARVLVNRVWQHLLGVGLVATTDNFGTMSAPPSHPELLDYLASQLVDNGWSLKSLIREIVTSRTYRLASEPSGDGLRVDPENRLLAHAHRRRLDAEALRDGLLAISGKLDAARGGLTIRKLSTYDYNYEFKTWRRSVYVPRFRNAQLGLFTAFDAATPNVVTGTRNVSILPTQALLLMNSPFVAQAAEQAAEVLLASAESDAARIELFYRQALGRLPADDERELAQRYLVRMREQNPQLADVELWSGWCQLLFCSLDFRYLN